MAISHYFNNYNSKYQEQRLVEDIIVESIKIQGFDAFYIPNSNVSQRDLLFGEDPLKTFTTHFQIEMYLSNSTEYMGEQEFFSKFGLEIRNQVKVILSKRSFTERYPQNLQSRPLEGDLVYVPFLNGQGELYEIKFVDQNKDYFALGRNVPYFYELSLEKFKYSNEIIATGNPDVDSIVAQESYSITLNTGRGTGNYITMEYVYQSPDGSSVNATSMAIVQSWVPSANALLVTNISGEFLSNNIIIGVSSNAQYNLVEFDLMNNQSPHNTYDNEYINFQANTSTDTSETNAFGSI